MSDSSRYATSNKRWVDLERSEQNNTTGDTGFKSDSSRQSDRSAKNKLGKHKFMGPYNAFQTSIASLNEKGALRKNDVDVSLIQTLSFRVSLLTIFYVLFQPHSVNTIYCSPDPELNDSTMLCASDVQIVNSGNIQAKVKYDFIDKVKNLAFYNDFRIRQLCHRFRE